ncbi:MAG: DUF1289 domain-containing protein [Hyphomicrobiales bacterium]
MNNIDTASTMENPADPCINLCVKDTDEDVCLGCGRTQSEIDRWATLSNSMKKNIIDQSDKRLDALTKKRREKRNARHRAKATLKNA